MTKSWKVLKFNRSLIYSKNLRSFTGLDHVYKLKISKNFANVVKIEVDRVLLDFEKK